MTHNQPPAPTPRTDASAGKYSYVEAEFARTLERELAALQAVVDELVTASEERKKYSETCEQTWSRFISACERLDAAWAAARAAKSPE